MKKQNESSGNGAKEKSHLPFFNEDELKDRNGYQEPEVIRLKLVSDGLPPRSGNGGLLEMKNDH